MDSTRRNALKSALAAALTSAAPLSVFRALAAAGPFRVPLADGTWLEFIEHTITHVKPGPKPNERPTRTAVVNGDFRMRGGTPLAIRGGAIQNVANGAAGEYLQFNEGQLFIECKSCPSKQKGLPPDAAQAALKSRSWSLTNTATGEATTFRAP